MRQLKGWWQWSAMALAFGAVFSGGYWAGQRGVELDPTLLQAAVAKVGDERITVDAFEQAMHYRGGSALAQLDKNALLDEMIQRNALLQQAYRLQLHKDPDLTREMENLLIGALTTRKLTPELSQVVVTDAQVESYYQAHSSEFTSPKAIRLAMLYLKAPLHGQEQDYLDLRQQLNTARQDYQAQSHTVMNGFGELAIRYSDDQASRYKGGDIGWLMEGQKSRWPPEMVKAAMALQEQGQISEVIETAQGLYVVMLTESRPAQIQALTKVKEKIRHQLFIAKQQQVRDHFTASMLADFLIEKYPNVLATIAQPHLLSQEPNTPPQQN